MNIKYSDNYTHNYIQLVQNHFMKKRFALKHKLLLYSFYNYMFLGYALVDDRSKPYIYNPEHP